MTMPGELYVGLMSGTSLDGVDGVLVQMPGNDGGDQRSLVTPDSRLRVLAHAHRAFPDALREEFFRLNTPGASDELHRAAIAAIGLTQLCAEVVQALARQAEVSTRQIVAIGAHGQTVRHQPRCGNRAADVAGSEAMGYTIQLNNPALLVELTGVSVVADFRSRDLAAGGQGAPLVPAFHRAMFWQPGRTTALLNLGGISNLTLLDGDGVGVRGFDCGPANVLMDHWSEVHLHLPFDAFGQWASTGQVLPRLLDSLMAEPYFSWAPPKSTGRDLFNPDWLAARLNAWAHETFQPEDVQATLCELTALSCAQALETHAKDTTQLLVCGGGALNHHLMQRLRHHLGPGVHVDSTEAHGLPPTQVEPAAFAWLAWAHVHRMPGNVPAVTGAAGPRILGAFHPA